MLKKNYRLSSVRLRHPRLIKSKIVSIKTSTNNLSHPRFGFVISKKLDKRAVIRNRAKRKLSSSIEEIFDRIEVGRDFVFYPKIEVVRIEQDKLNKEIQKLFEKEGFLK